MREEILLADGFEKGVLEWVEVPVPETMKEVLDTDDRSHDAATRKLENTDPARWSGKVPFMFQGQEVMNEPGGETAWGFLLSTRFTTAASSPRIPRDGFDGAADCHGPERRRADVIAGRRPWNLPAAAFPCRAAAGPSVSSAT